MYSCSILDYAPTQFQVKIKEDMYIDRVKANLKKKTKALSYYSFYLVTLLRTYFLFLFVKYDFSLLYIVNVNCF